MNSLNNTVVADDSKVAVTPGNYVRAETDMHIKRMYGRRGLGKLGHRRTLSPPGVNDILHRNRDTLYSGAICDLDNPAIATLPETNGRYQSLHVISQDHYSFVVSKPGRYELTKEKVGTRYAFLIFRTFVNAVDPKDIEQAHVLQDRIKVEGGASGPLEIPNWNTDQLRQARDALNRLATLGTDLAGAFGTKQETDPVSHFIKILGLETTFALRRG